MTEDQIEHRVEREMDRLDRNFLRGEYSQAEYDQRVSYWVRWASQQYRRQS